MAEERTRDINALTALLRTHDLGIDARRRLTNTQIHQVGCWRSRNEPLVQATARTEAMRLARRVTALDAELAGNLVELTELLQVSQGAALLAQPGFGPVATAICLMAWSHHGRIRSEAAFAALAGVNPIPASSGNTVRHRLNRGGDRRLNQALHMVALNRMTYDAETKAYVAKRQAEGRTTKEISSRCEALSRPTNLPKAQRGGPCHDCGLTDIEGSLNREEPVKQRTQVLEHTVGCVAMPSGVSG